MIKRSVSGFFLTLQGELDLAPRFCQTDMSHNTDIYLVYNTPLKQTSVLNLTLYIPIKHKQTMKNRQND